MKPLKDLIGTRQKEQLKKASISTLMRMTPYARDEGLIFEKNKKGEKLFFDHFYYESTNSKNIKNKIDDEIYLNATYPILIFGYSGSGKTTFLHSIVKGVRNCRIFDFEQITNTDDVDCIKNKVLFDIISAIDMKNYKEIFNVLYEFMQQNYSLIGRYLDNSDIIHNLVYGVIKQINAGNIESEGRFQKFLRDLFASLTLSQILTLDFLIALSSKVNNRKTYKSYICFDNLDNIPRIERLTDFLRAFVDFYLAAMSFMTEYKNGKYESIGTAFAYIVTLRETTVFSIASHNYEFFAWDNLKFDFSKTFEKNQIVKKRTEVLKKLDFLKHEQMESIDSIEKFVNNNYLNQYFFDIFNQNYRYSMRTIEIIANNNKQEVKRYNELCSMKNRNYYLLANGIIIKLLVNHFNQDGIFSSSLRLLDLHDRNEYRQVSISRVILTYLSNEGTGCKFNILLDAFEGIFTADEVCSTIQLLYDMARGRWCHLVTFSYEAKDSLEKQARHYKDDNIQEDEFSTIRITPAGISFLQIISVSFEFYSSRLINMNHFSSSPHRLPLVLNDNLKTNINRKYYFEVVIEQVFDSVKKCYQRLVNFDNEIMKKKNFTSFQQYCHSKYVFRKEDGNDIVHKEKLIFNHIGYINSFRLYLLSKKNIDQEEKCLINKILVQYIDKYLSLGEDDALSSTQSVSKEVYESLRKQIKYIKESNYNDFETKIETIYYFRGRYKY